MCFQQSLKAHTIIHRMQRSWQRVPNTWNGRSKRPVSHPAEFWSTARGPWRTVVGDWRLAPAGIPQIDTVVLSPHHFLEKYCVNMKAIIFYFEAQFTHLKELSNMVYSLQYVCVCNLERLTKIHMLVWTNTMARPSHTGYMQLRHIWISASHPHGRRQPIGISGGHWTRQHSRRVCHEKKKKRKEQIEPQCAAVIQLSIMMVTQGKVTVQIPGAQ